MLLTALLLAAGIAHATLSVSAEVVATATVETGPHGARVTTTADGEPPFAFAMVVMADGTDEAVALGPDWQSPERLHALATLQRYRPSMLALAQRAPRVEEQAGRILIQF